jgi:hypothetical protein
MKLLSLSQPNFAEMILGWSPSKSVSSISDLRRRWPPQLNSIFQQNLVEIGSVVSEEKIFFKFHHPFFYFKLDGHLGFLTAVTFQEVV